MITEDFVEPWQVRETSFNLKTCRPSPESLFALSNGHIGPARSGARKTNQDSLCLAVTAGDTWLNTRNHD